MRFSKRARRWIVLVAAIAGGVASIGAGSDGASVESHFVRPFGEDLAVFCESDDELAMGFAAIGEDRPGFNSASEAVDSWLDGTRKIAEGHQVPVDRRDSFRNAMQPSMELAFPVEIVVDDATYFDLPSLETDTIQARLVVENLETGYFVTESYVCSSELTDPDAWADFERGE